MATMEDRIRKELEAEAEKWIETELAVRMEHAAKEIKYQADVSSAMCGDEEAERHVQKASAYAEEEIRKELEHEARLRVEKELTRRMKFVVQEDSLEGRSC